MRAVRGCPIRIPYCIYICKFICICICKCICKWGHRRAVRMHPINSFELLFFAVFGQTTTEQTQVDKIKNVATPTQPYWVEYLFKIVFGIYMLVSVVVLINLLIAMMSDTYQRIQVVLLRRFYIIPLMTSYFINYFIYL